MTTRPGTFTREAVSLLDQIADTALDDDYHLAHERDRSARAPTAAWTLVMLALFALLVTAAAIQTRHDRPANEVEQRALAQDIEGRRATLQARQATAEDLRDEVESLQASTGQVDPELVELGVITADRAAHGPGIVVTVAGGDPDVAGSQVTDTDLQLLVNGLWYAGAEAISINGNRLGSQSSIRTAGNAITVNYRSVGPPYDVTVIGDPDSLRSRFEQNQGGAYWDLRRRTAGLRLSVDTSSDLDVPAAPARRLAITHAEAVEVDR